MDPKEVQKAKKTCKDNGIAVWLEDGCFLEVNPCLVPFHLKACAKSGTSV